LQGGCHVEFHKKLQLANSAFVLDPTNQYLKAQIAGLEKKVKEIEKRLNESLSMHR
jgi:hypothetical protein